MLGITPRRIAIGVGILLTLVFITAFVADLLVRLIP